MSWPKSRGSGLLLATIVLVQNLIAREVSLGFTPVASFRRLGDSPTTDQRTMSRVSMSGCRVDSPPRRV